METPQIPLRTLRAHAEALAPTRLTPRQQARQDRILLVATDLIARFGRAALNFSRLAHAMRYATSTLRWHFADLDALLLHIIEHHVENLTHALSRVPDDAPDYAARRRAAYRAATRTPEGQFTAAHRIFLNERHTLPPEETATIDQLAAAVQIMVLSGLPPEALAMLDDPAADPADIESLATQAENPTDQEIAPAPANESPARSLKAESRARALVAQCRTTAGQLSRLQATPRAAPLSPHVLAEFLPPPPPTPALVAAT